MTKKIGLICASILLLFCLTGCSLMTKVALDNESVNSYLNEVAKPDNITVAYQDVNGMQILENIKENASITQMATWMKVSDFCQLTGNYNNTWFYGWGSGDKLFVGYGEDKDSVYNYMKGYESKFAED